MAESEKTCAECNEPAELMCSACKLVSYCSKEHQKEHWKTHKSLCKPFEIQTTSDKGKCLVATRDLSPNDQIICDYPIVFGPRPHVVEEGPVPCPGCCRLIIAESAPRCEGCDWPVCNPNCPGLKDVNKHAHECYILGLRPTKAQKNLHNFYRQDALLTLRILLFQKRNQKKWQQILEMESHMDKRGEGTDTYKHVQERIVKYIQENFVTPLRDIGKQTGQELLLDDSDETIQKICGIIDVNSMEINQDAELSALYPTAYLMEHSCICNTYHVFDDEDQNYKITVRAALPIKKGDHITTMYTHALWGTQARREHLMETKYFECSCPRCSDPTELGTYLSALRCLGTENEPCGGTQLPIDPLDYKTEWACDKCKVKVNNAEVAMLVNQIGEEVDQIQLSKPTVKELNEMLKKVLTFLHPHHYHVYSLKHSLVQLYGYQQGYMPNQISDELLLEKAEMCRDLLETTRKIDPGNSRLCLYTAVLLHELHLANVYYIKRKWHTEDKEVLARLFREAKRSLEDAKKVLEHETTCAAGEKLRHLVESSEKDANKWINNHSEEVNELLEQIKESLNV
ncbi:SET domain-containing protein SmydA-8-like [Agrilus planipennis]|uniref:SET domain-containing protein SmydA-8-like n=1 Tax=Agrilus planipennis TaxID=224129 RepID=A0A1W4WTY4_AGRPL|nr:SET domain-containing protein SmydA-8-like [Agrilus planipennis]XP_025836572.1 SET domain-containing protein SmydA-8-like [Agrilus planipennis]